VQEHLRLAQLADLDALPLLGDLGKLDRRPATGDREQEQTGLNL
jgi:hypothetical protein